MRLFLVLVSFIVIVLFLFPAGLFWGTIFFIRMLFSGLFFELICF